MTREQEANDIVLEQNGIITAPARRSSLSTRRVRSRRTSRGGGTAAAAAAHARADALSETAAAPPWKRIASRETCLQDSAKRRSPGLVNLIPAVAFHSCLNLPAAFTQPGARLTSIIYAFEVV